MAKQKVSFNPIPNTDTDFTSLDPENGLPWSGKSIQSFIRSNLALGISAHNTRAGACYFNPTNNMQYFFKTKEEMDAWMLGDNTVAPLFSCLFTFEGTQYQMKIINKMDSDKLYFTTNSEEAYITVGYVSQRKGITDSQWEDVLEDAYFTVAIDRGNTGNYENVATDIPVLYGQDFRFNIIKHLQTGNNRVRLTCVGKNSNQVTSFIYTVSLTSMYLEASNFRWYIPFIEGESYDLGGMHIGGNINKVLHVKISNEAGYSKNYETNLGTSTSITNDYFFQDLEFPKGGTGIYNVEVWLDADGLESDHLIYNIMCISAADRYTTQLVAVSEIKPFAVNYAENALFHYAVYNGGAASANPHVNITAVVNTNPVVLMDETLADVDTSTPIPFNYNLEIETQETNLSLDVVLTHGISQKMLYEIDNSASYPPIGNTKFYLNAANRSNNQANKQAILNEANKSTVPADWQYTAFIDGIDGWTLDDNGRRCLLITAGSKVVIKEQLFKNVQNVTFEVAYKAKNVADYSEPIITCCDDASKPDFKGIKITPDKILLHSRDLNNPSNDLLQGYDTKDEEIIHALITITRNYKTNYGNLAQIYVNGGKKIEFEFNTSDSWEHEGNLIIGADNTDTYIYYVRVYDKAFGFQDAQQNHLSSLADGKLKTEVNTKNLEILDDSYRVDYHKCVGKYNCLTIEMLNNAKLPTYGMPKEYSAWCNVETFFAEHPEWNWIIKNLWIEGQGTTALNYWLRNLRFRLDKSNNLQVQYADGTISTIKKVKFNGDLHPEVERITAKKNYASSMQGNKMFGVEAYDDLYQALEYIDTLDERVALYQMPFLFFEKVLKEGTRDQYVYKFIGLFTMGPDKADPGTFGYDKPEAEDLISLEGTDHSVKGAGFNYPYDKLIYRNDAIAVNRGDGTYEDAFDVSFCKKTDKQAYLDEEFKPFYNAVYEHSCMIIGTNVPITEINNDVISWQNQKDADGHSYQRYEVWIDGEYDIYYLDRGTNKFTKNGTNLLTQLNLTEDDIAGLSITEKNNLFIQRRLAIYDSIIGNYLDRDVEAFHNAFCFIFGAKDNFIKNTYPFKVKKFIDGGRWQKRQDDLDSIMPYDNQGLSTAKYSVELFDWTDSTKSAYVFKGENSVLLQNEMRSETGKLKFKQQGKRILDAMYENAPNKSTYLEGLMSWVAERMFNKAQDYFSISLYNIDAEYSYEEAWPPYKDGRYDVDINPLAQSRGSAYETIKGWLEKRLIYCMSYFGAGPFERYEDTSLGRINFRTQTEQSFDLTPAIDLYPAVASGTVQFNSPTKVKEGETINMSGLGGTNTNVYIMAADYLSDIGDLSKLAVDASTNATLGISSKRLQRLKVGDINPDEVTTNIQTLSLGNCPSLETIDARNLESLTGDIDLTNCPRLKEAYFGNTDIRGINLKNGSKIKKLQTSSKLAKLTLQNLGFLELENFENNSTDTLEYIRIENCKVNPFGLLKQIYDTPNNQLKYIRVVGFDHTGTADDISLIRHLATDIDNQGNHKDYSGIDSDGLTGSLPLPVLEGHIRVPGNIYEDDYNSLKEYYPNLALEFSGGFYIRFKDPKVQEICIANWGDGEGITSAQMASVTSVGTVFKGNTEITEFPEFEKFKNVKTIDRYAFQDCTNLEKIDLTNIEEIKGEAFKNSGLTGDLALPNLKKIDTYDYQMDHFANTKIRRIVDLGTITYLDHYHSRAMFAGCTELEEVYLPDTFRYFSNPNGSGYGNIFTGCTSLKKVTNLDKVEVFGTSVFNNCTSLAIDIYNDKITTLSTAFVGSGITSFTAPNVEKLNGSDIFYLCKNLRGELNFPKLVADYLGSSFAYQSGIDKITNLGNIKGFNDGWAGRGAVSNCPNLKEVTLPSTIIKLGINNFRDCPNLIKVNFEDLTELTTIGDNAFFGCTSLEIENLSLPNLLTLGANAFRETNIKDVSDLGYITRVPSITELGGKVETYTIPTRASIIPERIAQNNTTIKKVTLHNKITRVGDYAFDNATNLLFDEINLPSVTYIGYAAFRGLTVNKLSNIWTPMMSYNTSTPLNSFDNIKGITEITPPKGVKMLYSFEGTNINIQTLPISIQRLGTISGLVIKNRILEVPNLKTIDNFSNSNGISKILNLGKITKLASSWMLPQYVDILIFPYTFESHVVERAPKVCIYTSIIPPNLQYGSYGEQIYVPDESYEAYMNANGFIGKTNVHPMSNYYTFTDITSSLQSNIQYTTNLEVYDVFDYTEVAESGVKSMIYDVAGYDTLKISGNGGSDARLYCFIDENDEVITTADDSLVANPLYICIPTMAKKMIINIVPTSTNVKVEIGKHIEE